jgi:hypothetical protein
MGVKKTVRTELEEQRLIIERQQVEILRQQHQMEMQRRRTAFLEAEIDAIKVTFQTVVGANVQPAKRVAKNGNGHRAAHRVGRATMSPGDQS